MFRMVFSTLLKVLDISSIWTDLIEDTIPSLVFLLNEEKQIEFREIFEQKKWSMIHAYWKNPCLVKIIKPNGFTIRPVYPSYLWYPSIIFCILWLSSWCLKTLHSVPGNSVQILHTFYTFHQRTWKQAIFILTNNPDLMKSIRYIWKFWIPKLSYRLNQMAKLHKWPICL